jgi:exodeoxyribonuclease X
VKRIRVIDYETQGFDPDHKVCEQGWCDLTDDGSGWTVGDWASSLHEVDHMPPQARAVHHISAAETKGFPVYRADDMWARAKRDGVLVLASHNNKFDAQHWGEPQLPLICTLKVARHLWPDAPGHSNGVLRYWLQDHGLIEPDEALCHPTHRAGPDTYVTAHILRHMLSLTSAAQMVAWTKLPLAFHVWGFGKHKGEKLTDTPTDYLDWVIAKSDLDEDTKWNCRRELDRRRAAA